MVNKFQTRAQIETMSGSLHFIFKDPLFAVVFHAHPLRILTYRKLLWSEFILLLFMIRKCLACFDFCCFLSSTAGCGRGAWLTYFLAVCSGAHLMALCNLLTFP